MYLYFQEYHQLLFNEISGDVSDPCNPFPVEEEPTIIINNTSNGLNITLPIDYMAPFAETLLDDEALLTAIPDNTSVTYKIVSG